LPGCYIFRDPVGQILYVGKSVALRTRLASYFATDRERKVAAMIRRAATVDWHRTASEVEALVLESALVKRLQPPYNVQLRAYPHYTFLRLADPGNENVPYLELTQGVGADGLPHFGPFWDRTSAEQARDFVNRLFSLRVCDGPLPTARVGRTCLHGQIRRCQAPCLTGAVGIDPYRQAVEDASALLRGDAMDLVARLEAERDRAASSLLFERAAELHRMAKTLRALHGKRRHLRSAAHVQNFVVVVHDESRVGAGVAQVLAFSGARLQGQVVVRSGVSGREDERRRALLLRFFANHFPIARALDIDRAELDQMHVVASWLARNGRRSRYVPMPDGAMTPDGIRAVVARAVIAVDEIPIVVDAATNGTDLGVPDASAAG
jgi:excinuclease UvrABC nuclease subunit